MWDPSTTHEEVHLTGQFLDQDSKEAIDFASIYIDGTFVGTTTTDISEERKTYNVFLSKAAYEILEVSVESESLIREREKCLKIFRKEFLGSSSNAKNSFIMNEEVITFQPSLF
mgnify:CR=1 FL=1